jgi:ornithine cyclodeaminase/alanine dehydrogenase-like protein (mu-crystallin family)
VRARLFVDSRAAALAESGDVLLGIQEGLFTERHVRGELGDLVRGSIAGRTSDADVTLFKSLGLAVEDVAAAELAYRRARERGVGAEVPC